MKRFLPRLTDVRRLLRPEKVLESSLPTVPQWVRKEEPLEDYQRDGYHPAAIGDVLGYQYRILRKLGWGRYSTVWLVQNQSNFSYAALKLMTAESSNAPELHELEYLQQINHKDPHHPGYPHVLHLSDHFYHNGPNGRHLCLVTDVLYESAASFMARFKYDRMPIAVAKHVTRQTILALDYLHNACNIVHTDIKANNILFVPNNLTDLVLSAVPEAAAQLDPNGDVISRVRSNPIPVPLPDVINKNGVWDDIFVKLTDVGVACWDDKIDQHFTDLIQSPALRAPEVCIGAGWGKPADIWSLGCTVYELVMGRSLIAHDIAAESVPYMHMLIFGSYPLEMIKRGKYSGVFFKEDGSQKYQLSERLPLEVDIQKRGAPPNSEDFIDFIKLMLQLDPALRATFKDLLGHRWLSCN